MAACASLDPPFTIWIAWTQSQLCIGKGACLLWAQAWFITWGMHQTHASVKVLLLMT